jgi:VWFA-related protein
MERMERSRYLSTCRLLLTSALVVGGATIVVRVQDGQQPAPIFKSRINVVRVDVSVTGRHDEPVADLQASDFEVVEDGVLQTVETVQFVRLDGSRTSDLEDSLEIRSPEHAALEAARDDVRVFAIFLDDYHIDKKPDVTLRVRRALKDFVGQFAANDLIAVMDPLTPLSHLRFTRSQEDLRRRMGEFEGRRGELHPVRSALEEGQLAVRDVWEVRGGVTLSALHALVTHLGGLREGRKSVLFVSQGPLMGPLGGSNEERLKDVLQAANRGNVTIHVFDPRPFGSGPFGGADVLQRLSRETGGRAIVNFNEPSKRLAQVIGDASAYYLLGYTPVRDLADGKFHRIDVKVRRPGVRVLARRGYWAPTEEEMNPSVVSETREPGLSEALSELVEPLGGRAVDVWIGASRGPNALTRLTVSWEPTGRTMPKRPSRLTIERVLDAGRGSVETRSIASGQDASAETTTTFDVEAATEIVLRLTAEAADGSVIDKWDQTMTVPALDGRMLALGTPRFLRARSAFEAHAMREHDPTPAASRRFRVTDRVVVEVECYGDQSSTTSARLLNAKGQALMELMALRVAAGKARFPLPLSSLAPSTYVLRIDAQSGTESVQHRTAFRIVP